jgi:hypothetical protein
MKRRPGNPLRVSNAKGIPGEIYLRQRHGLDRDDYLLLLSSTATRRSRLSCGSPNAPIWIL